ncbi:sugar transferase [Alphaproteobacteria bacterium]|nr:sugar transferase [Alphaproteobacteria bacterium]
MLEMMQKHQSHLDTIIVRIFDIGFASIALIALLPLLSVVAALLSITGEREVFYMQPRVGKNGVAFNILKFATMLKNSPNLAGGSVTVAGDPRILPMGTILRKTKINELPQLWNIIVGDMSIVGPRPQTPSCFKEFSEAGRQKIASVTPGLTGIGSLLFSDEEGILANCGQNTADFYTNYIVPYKEDLEIWYIENASLSLYFKVIILTATKVLLRSKRQVIHSFPTIPDTPEPLRSFI